ncbi:UDP-N-acetylglucosamine 2-epimerase (non-hydrolyzing) [Citricoccus nitrophenolicus]
MRIASIVGARPQFIKLAPISQAIKELDDHLEHTIVHTGQHYDPSMSQAIFDGLQIPKPDFNLGVGSASHGAQTGEMIAGLEKILQQQRPDVVLVYGDTNSTLAGALAAVKLDIKVAHLESGLRSFNRRMPEEINRIAADHISDLLLAPTKTAMGHLADEGLSGRSVLVGDVMTDVCFQVRDNILGGSPGVPNTSEYPADYLLATLHRAENTDDPILLRRWLQALQNLDRDVVLVAHPRLVAKAADAGVELQRGAVQAIEPLPYHQLVATVIDSAGVITDSGGLQKEAFLLGRLCTTMRRETEWVETLDNSWNVLASQPSELQKLVNRPVPTAHRVPYYGSGDAAEKSVQLLRETFK